MDLVLLSSKDEQNEDLRKNVQIFNRTTDRYIKTEIVHMVYDLGFDELAEAMAMSIYGETLNLKFLLGEYSVTDATNIPKPSNWLQKIKQFISIFTF